MWRKRIGWALLVVGLCCLVAGIAWGAIVWGDDDARRAAAGAVGGLLIAGILGIVWGGMTLAGDSGAAGDYLN